MARYGHNMVGLALMILTLISPAWGSEYKTKNMASINQHP